MKSNGYLKHGFHGNNKKQNLIYKEEHENGNTCKKHERIIKGNAAGIIENDRSIGRQGI